MSCSLFKQIFAYMKDEGSKNGKNDSRLEKCENTLEEN